MIPFLSSNVFLDIAPIYLPPLGEQFSIPLTTTSTMTCVRKKELKVAEKQ